LGLHKHFIHPVCKTTKTMNDSTQHESPPTGKSDDIGSSHHSHFGEPILKDAEKVDKTFPKAALFTVVFYSVLISATYYFTPMEEWEYLEGGEQQAAALAFVVLTVTILVQLMHICVGSEASDLSGVMIAALTVMVIAMITNFLMAFGPTVVTFDKFTNARVFLTRWCEWVPLAGLMTYLSEAVDIPNTRNGYTPACFTAAMQSLSCLCAFVFPMCKSFFWWSIWMTLAFVTFMTMIPRVWVRRQRFLVTHKGSTAADIEYYERRRFSYLLASCCLIIWGFLVVLFFINMYIHVCLPEGHYFRSDSASMIVDTIFDLIAKALYLRLIVDIHLRAFSSEGRVKRQLGELRRLLSVLWSSSSDVILISVKGSGKMTTMVSPSFPKLVGNKLPASLEAKKELALLFDMHDVASGAGNPQETEEASTNVSFIDSIALTPDTSFIASREANEPVILRNGSLLIRAAWAAAKPGIDHNSVLLVQKLRQKDGEDCHCEIKISSNGENSLVAIVRDVTERYRRFEAERRAHAEAVARQKDAHNVNRFTRHEVKNGLLAGIELCDSLRNAFDSIENQTVDVSSHHKDVQDDASTGGSSSRRYEGKTLSKKYISDLDSLLHETLDTVLAEAMAREVIHEVYRPRLERIDVKSVLTTSAWGIGEDVRFPLDVDKDMPYLMLDPQLVKYIHRNAVSNSCKYGKQEGVVVTRLRFDKTAQMLHLEVTNEPGPGHDLLRMMGEEATEAVFKQGSRLHTALETEDKRVSSGDGAWIVQKCAKTLGGKCDIHFLEDHTVFTFECPASPLYTQDCQEPKSFRVPPGTWGVAIDDSKVQRKLMNRILMHAGVEESRRCILGDDISDIPKLRNMLRGLLQADPNCKFLVLVDENLDFGIRDAKQAVLSGSKVMKEFLVNLPQSMEQRLLVLVRSANDSAEDVLGYLECTHGFFPKAPMQQDRVCEILAPLWADRFHKFDNPDDVDDSHSENSCEDLMTRQELQKILRKIDTILEGTPIKELKWSELWSSLHSFKGDIMTMGSSEDIGSIVASITSMRGPTIPLDFEKTWPSVRRAIVKVIGEPQRLDK